MRLILSTSSQKIYNFRNERTGLVDHNFLQVLHFAKWKYICAELNRIFLNISYLKIKFLELVRMWF